MGEKFGGLAADGGNTALKANMYIDQGNALGFVLANNYRPEGEKAQEINAFAPSGRQLLANIKTQGLPWAMFSQALQASMMTSNCK